VKSGEVLLTLLTFEFYFICSGGQKALPNGPRRRAGPRPTAHMAAHMDRLTTLIAAAALYTLATMPATPSGVDAPPPLLGELTKVFQALFTSSCALEVPAEEWCAWVWWLSLSLVACTNVYLLARGIGRQQQQQLQNNSDDVCYLRDMRRCACMFTASCAVRSFWPRVDVERTCFFDSIMSTTLVGRSFAFCAEMCFAWQLSSVLARIGVDLQRASGSSGRSNGFALVRGVAAGVFPVLCVAQGCCWSGVLTKVQMWHALEESLWMLSVGAVALSCAFLSFKLWQLPHEAGISDDTKWQLSDIKLLTHGFACCGLAFVCFMVRVDIPMYYHRYYEDEARGAIYFTRMEGLLDAMVCHSIRRDLPTWREEIPWMSGYFSVCVWFSIWLVRAPRIGGGEGVRPLSRSQQGKSKVR
jgi:hypothetical protein